MEIQYYGGLPPTPFIREYIIEVREASEAVKKEHTENIWHCQIYSRNRRDIHQVKFIYISSKPRRMVLASQVASDEERMVRTKKRQEISL